MNSIEPVSRSTATQPFAVRIGLAGALGMVLVGAVYLYAVRGTAILLDLANGMAGMFCF